MAPIVTESVSAAPKSDEAENKELIEQSDATEIEPRRVPPMRVVLGWLPNLAVFALLGGIGWYGHHHDWKLPPASAITGTDAALGSTWCDSHGVPEGACIVCDPSLIEQSPELRFCVEHGVHGCVLHQPGLAQSKIPVTPTNADFDRANRALGLFPRAENLSLGSTAGSRIQFASIDAMNKAGVDVEPVTRANITESLPAAGEIQYDATKTARVSPTADGIVRQIKAHIGDWVEVGDVLAIVDSQGVGQLKAALLSAVLAERLSKDQVSRFETLAPSGAIPGRKLLEGKSELQQATVAVEQAVRGFGNLGIEVDASRLRGGNLDAVKAYVRSIGMEHIEPVGSDNLIAVVAPMEGRVTERATTIGEVVDRGSEMFRIVDTRTVWLDLRVPVEQASLAEIGLPVRFQPDGSRQVHSGKVTWVSTDVDPQTRTVRVRAELANADGRLRNESFGGGEVILREETDAIVVPEKSLRWDGSSSVVFVRDARFFEKDRPKFFVTRSVRPGAKQDGKVEIIAGVLPGEIVATEGSDVLRAQLLRSNLGAGCTCGH